MKNKALAILLCLGLCIGLTACGGEDKGKEKPAVESAASVNNGDLKEDSTALTIGKTKVPYNEYQAYYYFMKNQYENVLNADIWKYTGAGALHPQSLPARCSFLSRLLRYISRSRR